MELGRQSASLAGRKPSIPSPSIAQTCVPVIPAFGTWRPENQKFKVFPVVRRKFKASLGYRRPSLKKEKKSVLIQTSNMTDFSLLELKTLLRKRSGDELA